MGIATLEERISDVKERLPKYTNRSDFEDLVTAAKNIETEIQGNLAISVSEIDKESVSAVKEDFSNVNF